MNKLQQLFQKKPNNLLSIFFTAGYPQLEDTIPLIQYLCKSSVDFIEIGFPFSDPLADGPTIQATNYQAIQNGMTLSLLFKQLSSLPPISTPLILMGYLNPILQMGIPQFLHNCSQNQIDAIIIPDLPFDYYEKYFQKTMSEYNICSVFLVTPSTPPDRLNQIKQFTTGFVYVVSDNSITGKNIDFQKQKKYLENLQQCLEGVPKIIGFGIKDPLSFQTACQFANGAIIGSAFLNHLKNHKISLELVQNFIQSIRL